MRGNPATRAADTSRIRSIPRIASNKYYRHSVAQDFLVDPASRFEIAGQIRQEEPPQRIDEPDLGIHPSDVLRLIDTLVGSPKGHYVNRVADTLLKATRISIGGGLRRDAFGDLVSILHVSADCAEGGII